MNNTKDTIFAEKQENVEPFSFDSNVVSVFPDMIRRSVPGYSELVSLIGTISAKYAKPGTDIYDLGCSLGAVSMAIAAHNPDFDGKIIAVDNSEPMIQRLSDELLRNSQNPVIIPELAGVEDIVIKNASFIVMNLTLQFIADDYRDAIIENIYNGLNHGGAFILSEKITSASEEEDECLSELLFNYKRCRGYSDIEIEQKRDALENVLVPETCEQHIQRLKNGGFSAVYQWFRSFNFISLIALK